MIAREGWHSLFEDHCGSPAHRIAAVEGSIPIHAAREHHWSNPGLFDESCTTSPQKMFFLPPAGRMSQLPPHTP